MTSPGAVPAIVLASASASRVALLRAAGVPFTSQPASIDEAAIKDSMRAAGATAAAVAESLAELKAKRISSRTPDDLVIGADQMLNQGADWFDKPEDRAGARRQLQALRGKTHILTSAVVVVEGGAAIWRHVASARLAMRNLSDGFIEDYLDGAGATVIHSVGAYQLEGMGAQLFDRIDGDYFCILGLPLLPLLGFLRQRQVIPT